MATSRDAASRGTQLCQRQDLADHSANQPSLIFHVLISGIARDGDITADLLCSSSMSKATFSAASLHWEIAAVEFGLSTDVTCCLGARTVCAGGIRYLRNASAPASVLSLDRVQAAKLPVHTAWGPTPCSSYFVGS